MLDLVVDSSLLRAAVSYATELKWLVLLIRLIAGELPEFVHPSSTGAGRLPQDANWCKKALTDPAQIQAEWCSGCPPDLVGIQTGAVSGIIVLDIRRFSGGRAIFDAMMTPTGSFKTPTVATPIGGYHTFFQHPGGFIPGIEDLFDDNSGVAVRADRDFVLAPPSVHLSNKTYMWLQRPGTVPLAPLPDFILEQIRKRLAERRADQRGGRPNV
ncbi:bifunctional DNA primase/polymerase [Candidatus Eisenbacteria bacterium]|uniref:Bifunctional DNA primase/polymerase n=1 Tax=Eiseniibacteriota bacterium TaxID=2212470 RepID=A0ABV6YKS7_UNCEI